MQVHCQHRARLRHLGQVAGLPPRRGAGVEDAGRSVRRREQRHELRRLVLRLEETLLVSLDVQCGGRSRREDQRVGTVFAWMRLDPGLPQRVLRLLQRGLPPRHAHGRGRLLLVRRAQLLRLGRAQPARPALDHPARMGGDRRDVPHRVYVARGRRRGRPGLRQASQHGVDESRRARRSQLLGQLHRLVHRRVRGDLRVVQELEGAEAKRHAHRLVQVLQRAIAVCPQRPVELELPAQGAVGQLRGQRHLARLQDPGLPQGRVEGEIREGPVLRHPQEHVRRDAPRWRRHARLLSRGA